MEDYRGCAIRRDQIDEFMGVVVDIFEDYAEWRGITLPNEDRDEAARENGTDEGLAILYGEDYDEIAGHIEEIFYLADDCDPGRDGVVPMIDKEMLDEVSCACLASFIEILARAGIMDATPHTACETLLERVRQAFIAWGFFPEDEAEDTFKIYQILDVASNKDIVFEGYETLKENGLAVNPSLYNEVYSAHLEEGTEPEQLFERFNLDRPFDYRARSMSVSDIVVLRRNGEKKAYYCDSFGFVEVPEFLKEGQREK